MLKLSFLLLLSAVIPSLFAYHCIILPKTRLRDQLDLAPLIFWSARNCIFISQIWEAIYRRDH